MKDNATGSVNLTLPYGHFALCSLYPILILTNSASAQLEKTLPNAIGPCLNNLILLGISTIILTCLDLKFGRNEKTGYLFLLLVIYLIHSVVSVIVLNIV